MRGKENAHEKANVRMKCLPQLVVLVLSAISTASANGQLILGQVREDYRQPMSYSPSDPFVRSSIFQAHTGHSGRYYNCDGEEEKRNSPYIQWATVCNGEHIRPWGEVLRCDIQEVKRRVQSGACCGDKNCDCTSCRDNQGLNLALLGSIHATENNHKFSAPNDEPSHLAYGRRATRMATEEQKSTAKQFPASNPTRFAERPEVETGTHIRRR